MTLCPWCGQSFDVPQLFHVCNDGTTYPDRIRKTAEDLAEQRAKQDRFKAGYQAMKEYTVPTSEIVSLRNMPEQPKTGNWFRWTPEDLDLARKMKIRLEGK